MHTERPSFLFTSTLLILSLFTSTAAPLLAYADSPDFTPRYFFTDADGNRVGFSNDTIDENGAHIGWTADARLITIPAKQPINPQPYHLPAGEISTPAGVAWYDMGTGAIVGGDRPTVWGIAYQDESSMVMGWTPDTNYVDYSAFLYGSEDLRQELLTFYNQNGGKNTGKSLDDFAMSMHTGTGVSKTYITGGYDLYVSNMRAIVRTIEGEIFAEVYAFRGKEQMYQEFMSKPYVVADIQAGDQTARANAYQRAEAGSDDGIFGNPFLVFAIIVIAVVAAPAIFGAAGAAGTAAGEVALEAGLEYGIEFGAEAGFEFGAEAGFELGAEAGFGAEGAVAGVETGTGFTIPNGLSISTDSAFSAYQAGVDNAISWTATDVSTGVVERGLTYVVPEHIAANSVVQYYIPATTIGSTGAAGAALGAVAIGMDQLPDDPVGATCANGGITDPKICNPTCANGGLSGPVDCPDDTTTPPGGTNPPGGTSGGAVDGLCNYPG